LHEIEDVPADKRALMTRKGGLTRFVEIRNALPMAE